MKKGLKVLLLLAISFNLFAKDFDKAEVMKMMTKVADWEYKEPVKHGVADWTNGALYCGMMEFAKIAENKEKYYDWLIARGDKANWGMHPRKSTWDRYHADDYAVSMMYIEMYKIKKDPKMIEKTRALLDKIESDPSTRGLEFCWHKNQGPTERWSWCDALFMAPTVWAKMYKLTGEPKYLHFMYKEYKATTDYLYDHRHHLYYRDSRYFHQKEPNGKPMFWGRGNGWVFGGLTIILDALPDRYEEKMWFEKLFEDMAASIAKKQDENGYWHASMLDPKAYPNPETSSSSFFTFGLAWGINHGYLDKEKYLPVVKKAWKALCEAVYPDGKLGWVQPIGENPKTTKKDMTEVYGVGAFLLAGTEILKLAE
jgi:rhamnogalacturonyl hydrolase YesR